MTITNLDQIQDTDLLACTDTNGVTHKVTGDRFKELFVFEPPVTPPDHNPIYKLITGSVVEPLATASGGYDATAKYWWTGQSIGSTVPCIFPGSYTYQAAILKVVETKPYDISGAPGTTLPSKFEVISSGSGFPSPAGTVKLGKGTDDFSLPATLAGVNWPVERE